MSLILKDSVSFAEAFSVLPFIKSLDVYYPDISHWYINKVIPGIMLGDDKLVIASDNGRLAGVALSKSGVENKLRCIRVHPDYANNGLGIRLIDRSLELIGDSKPAVTVSEELIHHYSRIFVNRYGFELSAVDKGTYRARKLEYRFNS